MGQLLYVMISVLVSLLCIAFFGGDRRYPEQKQKRELSVERQGTPRSIQGES
jgi:hypothetical protein